jgi:hypothetical protein
VASAPTSEVTTSEVPTFVAAGKAGEDGLRSSELGGLLGAGGFLAAASAFIASRRRKGAKA